MTERARWCRVTLEEPGGRVLGSIVLEGEGAPDLSAVDRVARCKLVAGRIGVVAVLHEVSEEMRDLLELAGLRVEMEREAEGGEEAVGVEEGEEAAQLRDPPS
jgi:hypothetical protein